MTMQQHTSRASKDEETSTPAARGGKAHRRSPREERVLVAQKRRELMGRGSVCALQEFFDGDPPWHAVRCLRSDEGELRRPATRLRARPWP